MRRRGAGTEEEKKAPGAIAKPFRAGRPQRGRWITLRRPVGARTAGGTGRHALDKHHAPYTAGGVLVVESQDGDVCYVKIRFNPSG